MNRILLLLTFIMSGILFADAERVREHVLEDEHASIEIGVKDSYNDIIGYIYFFIPGDSDLGYMYYKDALLINEGKISEFKTSLSKAYNKYKEWQRIAIENLPNNSDYETYRKELPIAFPAIDCLSTIGIDRYFSHLKNRNDPYVEDYINIIFNSAILQRL